MNNTGVKRGRARGPFGMTRAFRWVGVLLLIVALFVATALPIQGDSVYANTVSDPPNSTTMGDPDDCWWVGLPCLIF